MEEKLKKVSTDMDKREGSIIWDTMAGNSLETKEMLIQLEDYYKQTFASTSDRKYLIERCKERGITPKLASKAVLKGVFDNEVPIGARFSLNEFNYITIEKINDFSYKMECETLGSAPNGNFGELIPIDYVKGLTQASLTELLIPGEDEEETEKLRKRYFESFDGRAFGGNIKDYEEKTLSISGVGAVKVTPVWKGGGTVKLTILNSEFDLANPLLIEEVQEAIDPTKDGSGLGLAPIDHIVTIETAQELKVNVDLILELNDIDFFQVKNKIETLIEEYFLELRKGWASQEKLIVRISNIESRILQLNEVIDIKDTKLNGIAENLTLNKYQIPKLGEISNVSR